MNKGYRLLEPTSEMGIAARAESFPKVLEAMARGLTMMLYWCEHSNPAPEEPRIDTLQDGMVMGDLAKQDILVRAFGRATVTDERPEAYKECRISRQGC